MTSLGFSPTILKQKRKRATNFEGTARDFHKCLNKWKNPIKRYWDGEGVYIEGDNNYEYEREKNVILTSLVLYQERFLDRPSL